MSDRDEGQARTPQDLADELATLPPAERFERLIDFPTDHTFKAIGAVAGFEDALRQALADLGQPGATLSIRPSSGGKYVAISFDLHVESGARLVELYERLGRLPGLKTLL